MNGSKFLQVLTLLVCLGMVYFCYRSFSETQKMHVESQEFFTKADSLLSVIATQKATKSNAKSTAKPTGFWEQLAASVEASDRAAARAEAAQKIKVSAAYRIEDRYVVGSVEMPDIRGNEAGVVAINIIVDRSGNVQKTSVNPATTITDENVIDSARKAALKTDFNSNYDASETQNGVITYNYKLKK